MDRVLFIEGAPAPYRVDFWNELGWRVDLTVWFQAGHEKGRLWDIEGLGDEFRYVVLPGLRVGEDKYFNPGITARLRAERFDACIMSLNCSPTEILAARWLNRRKIPFIFKSDGGFPMRGVQHRDQPRQGNGIKEFIKRKTFPMASLWLSSGSNCTRYLEYYGADPRRIIEYPLAVRHSEEELRALGPLEWATRRSRERFDSVVCILPTRLIPGKGIETTLEAFSILRDEPVTLLLIGSGPLEDECRYRIATLGLTRVVMKPWLRKEDLALYYKLSDVFLFPTLMDTWGLAINEGMAHGLPVIATSMAGAAYDLVRENENGFIIQPDDPQQLADRLRTLIADADLRARFGERSRVLIADYTIPRMADRFVAAVRRLGESDPRKVRSWR